MPQLAGGGGGGGGGGLLQRCFVSLHRRGTSSLNTQLYASLYFLTYTLVQLCVSPACVSCPNLALLHPKAYTRNQTPDAK